MAEFLLGCCKGANVLVSFADDPLFSARDSCSFFGKGNMKWGRF